MTAHLPGDLTIPRTDNVDGDEHCRYCCTSLGLVVVGSEHTQQKIDHVAGGECPGCFEMYGPCPFCERGRLAEFPERGRGPWGKDGYWKGMPYDALRPSCVCDEKPQPMREQAAQWRELRDRMASSHDLNEEIAPKRPPVIAIEKPVKGPAAGFPPSNGSGML
jgi:hypothetical protein